jgi:glycosyltransferase involved in cell wall biosynthesis
VRYGRPVNPPSAGAVTFSIIVPTYDRPHQLAACLRALTNLDYPPEQFELIVVDDGSPEAPDAVAAPDRDRLNVTFLSQPRAGPASARNTGAAHAKGKYLAFTDDDCVPAADWLQRLAARFAIAPEQMVGGTTVNGVPGNLYSAASQLLIGYLYAHYNADSNQAVFLTSNNMAMAAALFRKVGGFDVTFPRAAGEDRELCDRWLRNKFGITFAPEAVVHHEHVMSFSQFCRQHFNYGRAAYHFHRKRRGGAGRMKVEAPSFYWNLVGYPLSRERGFTAVRLSVLLFLSQAANALGFCWEWRAYWRARS